MSSGESVLRMRWALLVLAIWMAALWAACVLVPTAAFSVLPDPSLAGRVAGRSFFFAACVGAVAGVATLALTFNVYSRLWLGLVVTCALLPVASELFVGPAMRAARLAGDSQAVSFYHSVGSVLFLSAAILATVLFWRQTRPLVSPAV